VIDIFQRRKFQLFRHIVTFTGCQTTTWYRHKMFGMVSAECCTERSVWRGIDDILKYRGARKI